MCHDNKETLGNKKCRVVGGKKLRLDVSRKRRNFATETVFRVGCYTKSLMYDLVAFSRLDCAQRSQLNKNLSLGANWAFHTINSGSLVLCKFKLMLVREYRLKSIPIKSYYYFCTRYDRRSLWGRKSCIDEV